MRLFTKWVIALAVLIVFLKGARWLITQSKGETGLDVLNREMAHERYRS